MNRGFLALILTFALALFASDRASAWNATGHEIVALLAYQSLDAAAQKKIQAILKDHPHYDEYLARKNAAGTIDLDKVAMNAANWSDWIRSNHTKQFHKGTWHYVNKPFIVLPDDDVETRNKIEAAFKNPKINRGDILRIIPESRKIIHMPADTPAARRQRAIRLCWLFHLVGDLHQPMHAVAMCTKELPDGDRGGNSVWVTPKKGQDPKRLHAVWDDMLGSHDDVRGIVRDIQEKVRVKAKLRKITDPNIWADESTAYAKSHAYRFKGKMIDFIVDPGRGPAKAPLLPEGYQALGEEVARERVALAGARLADLLKAELAE